MTTLRPASREARRRPRAVDIGHETGVQPRVKVECDAAAVEMEPHIFADENMYDALDFHIN